jgi:hypothetical protein
MTLEESHAIIFGEIGLLPHEYYQLLPREFMALIKGYNRRKYAASNERRMQSFISVLPFVKNISYQKFCNEFWSLPGDKEAVKIERPEIDAETWEAIKKQLRPREQVQQSKEYEDILQKHKIITNG